MKTGINKTIHHLIRKTRIYLLFGLYLAFAFASISILINIFSVREVVVEGASDINGIDILSNKLIFLVDKKKAERILYNQNPNIEKVSLTKAYPNKIIISTNKAEAIAFLSTDDGGLFLNSEGRILKKIKGNNPQGIPIINYYQGLMYDQYSSGDSIDLSEIVASLYILDRIKQIGLQIDSVDIRSLDMLILKDGISEYIFSASKDPELQYKQLKDIVRHYRIEGKQIRRLDLRFNKPIITESQS